MVWTNSSSSTRHRLWRNTDRGILAGVCAGIADFIGVEPIVVRLAAVLGLIFFFLPTVAAYVILAIVLRPKPPALYASPDEEAFWRGVGTAPTDTLHSLKRKFADLEARLGRMESEVTSGDFDLHRKFRDLGR
jgi:phage shock protein C